MVSRPFALNGHKRSPATKPGLAMPNITRRHYRPELLPDPRIFYESELGPPRRGPSRGWVSYPCPFCDSNATGKRKYSAAFGVNLYSPRGPFKCLRCDKAGDIIGFVMQRYGLSFKAAAQSVGAWDAWPTPDTLRQIERRQRECEALRLRKAEEHKRLLALRDELLAARCLYRDVTQQLTESRGGDAEWHLLPRLHDYVHECDMKYCAAAGLEFSE